MRDVHLRAVVDLNLSTLYALLEQRHLTRAARRRLTDVHAFRAVGQDDGSQARQAAIASRTWIG
jgi:hypothetical protein